jgi:hypothetical protein
MEFLNRGQSGTNNALFSAFLIENGRGFSFPPPQPPGLPRFQNATLAMRCVAS